jgi:hypothetical protein
MPCASSGCDRLETVSVAIFVEVQTMTDTSATTPENAGDPLTDPAASKQTVINDAVAGETVIDNGNYAGPTGSEPVEAEPALAENDLAGDDIDLRDEE